MPDPVSQPAADRDLAHRAAQRIAHRPHCLGNPVLFHGSSGSGKTRLLRFLARSAKRPGSTVFCASLNRFWQGFRRRLRSGSRALEEWKRELIQVDFFLLDGVEKLLPHRHTQQFLLEVWDPRLAARRQIVVTSRIPAADLVELDPRLRNRLEAGFPVAMAPPPKEPRNLDSLAQAVANKFDLAKLHLQSSPGRRAALGRAAFVAVALENGFSGGELAQFLGGRSLASVRHARRRSRTLIQEDPKFREMLESLAYGFSPSIHSLKEV